MANEDRVNLASYTDEQLIDARNNLDIMYGKYVDEWGKEVGVLINEKKVDPYSFFGERKINKVINKYADITADIRLAIEEIEIELQKRDNYKFEQSFIGGKKYHDDTLTAAEFFEKEQLKTMKYKQSITDDKLNDED